MLIDVAIPSDRNVIQKKAEKKLKYKNLNIEIAANVEYEMLGHTGHHGVAGIATKGLKIF
jgi:hypothetical protein